MKPVSYINQHIAIWSFLCGDHALKKEVKLISNKLLNEPDFLDPLENKLRLEVFKHKRNWIYEYMGENASFCVAETNVNKLAKFQTCFSGINLEQYTNEYVAAHEEERDFFIERSKEKADIKKGHKDVEKQYELKQQLNRRHPTFERINKYAVLDAKQFNEDNILLAANRCWVMKSNDKHVIIDGNHRLTAYYWAKQIDKNIHLHKRLFCFYFVMNRQ